MRNLYLLSFINSFLMIFSISGSLNHLSAQTTQTFNTPGSHTFTVPAGVTQITVEAWGGGGKGATMSGSGGGGAGGGGAYSSVIDFTVIPGNTYTLFVGSGSNNEDPGGDSWFINTTTLLAKGGNSVSINGVSGASGGNESSGVGDMKFSGGNGANGGSSSGGGGSSAGTNADGNDGTGSSGGVAPSGGGNGGNGVNSGNGDGQAGSSPGGGGGGARRQGGGAPTQIGGFGAHGQVIITYTAGPVCSDASLSLTPGAGSDDQTVCINTAIMDITYDVGGDATGADVSGLPTGVSGSFSSGVFTISGTPTQIGIFNYTVNTTGTPSPCIEASMGGTITVDPNVSAGTVSGAASLCIGDQSTFTSNGDPGGEWSSTDPGVATVDANTGEVTAVSAGSTDIVYTISTGCGTPVSSQQSLTVHPNVDAGTITGVSPLCIGDVVTFTSSGNLGGEWTSSDASVANVDIVSGEVTAQSAGSATITYSIINGCGSPVSATFVVTVDPNMDAGTVSGAASLCIGDQTTFTSNGDPGGEWSSTDPGVATVDANSGEVTAVSAGSTDIVYTISAGCGSPVSSQQSLIVHPNVDAGTITGVSPLCIGDVVTFTSSGNLGSEWISSDAAVATVDIVSGEVTAQSAGSATITYSIINGCGSPVSATFVVTVDPNMDAGTVSGAASLCIGDQSTFTSNGDPGGEWSSTDPGVATVNANTGEVTAVSAGSTDIVYTINTGCGSPVSAQHSLTVNPLPNNTSNGFNGSTICLGDNGVITFDAIDATFVVPYTIEYSDGINTWTQNIPTAGAEAFNVAVNPTSTTIYTLVSITNGNGCTRTTGFGKNSAQITVRPTADASISSDATVCVNDAINIVFTRNTIGTSASFTYTYSINGGPDQTISGTGNITIPVNTSIAGVFEYELISVGYTSNPNCTNLINETATITVNETTAISTPSNQSITYGDNAFFNTNATGSNLNYQWQVDEGSGFGNISDGGFYSGSNTHTLTLDVPTVAMSGFEYRVVVTGDCGTETSIPAKLTVNPFTIYVTADAQTKTYGDADPALTFQHTPSLVAGDAFSGGLVRDAGEGVGSYAINQGTLSLSSNYILDYTGANLTITELTIFVSADAQSKTYGDADPVLTFQHTPSLVAGDAFSGGLVRDAGEDIGSYAINQGSLSLSSNYILDYTGANLTITELTIFVAADAQSKTYGDADPALTFQHTPSLVAGDAFSGGLVRDAGEDIGSYAINQGSLSLSSNYILDYTGANLTITELTIFVTADAQSKTYGDADPVLTFQHTPSLVAGDAFSGGLVRDSGEDVGSYAINQGTLSLSSNYILDYTGANLTITELTIFVTADAQSKTYGDADPVLTFQHTPSLVAGDAFSGGLVRDAGEDIGSYAINQGSLSLSSNYILDYTGANLTIGQLAVAVNAEAKSKTYGDVDPALTFVSVPSVGTVLANGEVIGFTGALSRDPGEDVGAYAINRNTVDNTNYDITYTGANLTIGQLAVAVTAEAKSKTYGDVDPALTFVSVPSVGTVLANGEVISFTGALNRDPGEDVGSYAINRNTVDNTNYDITYTGADLSITHRPITITVDAGQSKVYGSPDPELTYSVGGDGLAPWDEFAGELERAPGETVAGSPYAISKGTLLIVDQSDNNLDKEPNYTITFVPNNFTITQAPVVATVVVSPGTVQYSDPVTFTATITGGAPLVSGGPQAAVSATFRVNNLVMGTANFVVVGDDLVALLADVPMVEPNFGEGTMAPGNKTVSADVNGVDNNYNVNPNPAQTTLIITKEDASITYIGQLLIAESNSGTPLNFFAVIQDSEIWENDDLWAGDITNATVQYKIFLMDGNSIPEVYSSPVLNVTDLLTAGDNRTGVVSHIGYTMPALGSNEEARIYGVEITVNNYYTGFTAKEDLLVTLYKPVGDFITGGGYIFPENPDPTVGLYPAAPGTRSNFGFNVRFNPAGKNLRGRLNVIWRTLDGRIFQARSNSIESLGVDISNEEERIAVFQAKSNVRDLSPNSSSIPNSGNVQMFVTMTDRGEPGHEDQIGFTLWRQNELWYSSNWISTNTQEMYLGGGNLIVHSGFSSGALVAPDITNIEVTDPDTFTFLDQNGMEYDSESYMTQNYPNPFSYETFIDFVLGKSSDVTLQIYDGAGVLVKHIKVENLPKGKHQYNLKAEDLPSGLYHCVFSDGTTVDVKRIILKR